VTSPFDVEYGRGLGQLQLVTRSGSNAFHGSLFEEHRDTDLNANNWFSNAAGTNPIRGLPIQPRQILVSNQFGGRVGGPIKRNKTFFNFYYEGQRQIAKNNVIATVLTPSQAGNCPILSWRFEFRCGVSRSDGDHKRDAATTGGRNGASPVG